MRLPTPHPDLNAILRDLASSARAALGDRFTGAYLHGSFALGDFDEYSDVDFLVVVEEPVSQTQLAVLQAMHARIYGLPSPWAQHLEGSYFPRRLLRCPDPSSSALPYLDNGSRSLIPSNHDNTVVVRWVVRRCGIPLAGPPSEALIDPVSADDLRGEVRTTIRDWGRELLSDPRRMSSRWSQAFAALSFARMLSTLETGMVDSKLAAVRWAAEALEPRWRDLVARAWADRPHPSLKIRQPADPDELANTHAFVRFAISSIGA